MHSEMCVVHRNHGAGARALTQAILRSRAANVCVVNVPARGQSVCASPADTSCVNIIHNNIPFRSIVEDVVGARAQGREVVLPAS